MLAEGDIQRELALIGRNRFNDSIQLHPGAIRESLLFGVDCSECLRRIEERPEPHGAKLGCLSGADRTDLHRQTIGRRRGDVKQALSRHASAMDRLRGATLAEPRPERRLSLPRLCLPRLRLPRLRERCLTRDGAREQAAADVRTLKCYTQRKPL